MLSLGARMYSIDQAIGFARIFLSTPFSGGPRHSRRLAMIAEYEKSGDLPPLPRLLTRQRRHRNLVQDASPQVPDAGHFTAEDQPRAVAGAASFFASG